MCVARAPAAYVYGVYALAYHFLCVPSFELSHCPCLQASRWRNMLNTVEELAYFIGASPQRLECYLSSTEDKQRLKKFSETRWSQHDLCLASLLDKFKYHEFLGSLDLIQQVRDPRAWPMAGSLSKTFDPFPFLIWAVTSVTGFHDADGTVRAENSETVTPFPFQGARRAFGIIAP